MKQVSNTKSFLSLSFFFLRPISQGFLKYRLVLLLIGITLLNSCQKGDNDCKKSVPFNAVFETKEAPVSPTHSVITGIGELKYLGKSTFVAEVYLDNFPLVTGTQIITTAIGDKITSSFTGSIIGPDDNGILLITNNNTITGGTGRFAGASGSFIQKAIAYTYTPIGSATFDGTITLNPCYLSKK